MVNRAVTGARYGVGSWLMQRVSAGLMALYTVTLMVSLMITPANDWGRLSAVLHLPGMRYFTLIFLFALFIHAWIGMRDIFMDYVRHTGMRLLLHTLVVIALVLYAVWAIRIAWGTA